MTKLPSFQFYPADWRKDLELQSCSIEARGLWIELMCLMHQATPYGYLMVNNQIIGPNQACNLIGISSRKYRKLLDELVENGVARITAEGAVYSKRMVEDHRLREIRKQSGKLGGNPNLVNQKDKQTDNQKPTPSSSSSSSSSTSNKEEEKLLRFRSEPDESWNAFIVAWADRYGRLPSWSEGHGSQQEYVSLTGCLKKLDKDKPRLLECFKLFLADDDKYLVENVHRPSLLTKRLDKYLLQIEGKQRKLDYGFKGRADA